MCWLWPRWPPACRDDRHTIGSRSLAGGRAAGERRGWGITWAGAGCQEENKDVIRKWNEHRSATVHIFYSGASPERTQTNRNQYGRRAANQTWSLWVLDRKAFDLTWINRIESLFSFCAFYRADLNSEERLKNLQRRWHRGDLWEVWRRGDTFHHVSFAFADDGWRR